MSERPATRFGYSSSLCAFHRYDRGSFGQPVGSGHTTAESFFERVANGFREIRAPRPDVTQGREVLGIELQCFRAPLQDGRHAEPRVDRCLLAPFPHAAWVASSHDDRRPARLGPDATA